MSQRRQGNSGNEEIEVEAAGNASSEHSYFVAAKSINMSTDETL